jgi:hypothetical protein
MNNGEDQRGLYRDNRDKFGERVNFHCPYDEAQLRRSVELPGRFICPCCWTSFDGDNHD